MEHFGWVSSQRLTAANCWPLFTYNCELVEASLPKQATKAQLIELFIEVRQAQ